MNNQIQKCITIELIYKYYINIVKKDNYYKDILIIRFKINYVNHFYEDLLT